VYGNTKDLVVIERVLLLECAFVCVSEPVAFLDILGPPYNPKEGRDCNYYFKADETSSSG